MGQSVGAAWEAQAPGALGSGHSLSSRLPRGKRWQQRVLRHVPWDIIGRHVIRHTVNGPSAFIKLNFMPVLGMTHTLYHGYPWNPERTQHLLDGHIPTGCWVFFTQGAYPSWAPPMGTPKLGDPLCPCPRVSDCSEWAHTPHTSS